MPPTKSERPGPAKDQAARESSPNRQERDEARCESSAFSGKRVKRPRLLTRSLGFLAVFFLFAATVWGVCAMVTWIVANVPTLWIAGAFITAILVGFYYEERHYGA